MTRGSPLIRGWEPGTDLPVLLAVGGAADTLFAEQGLVLPPDDAAEETLRASRVLVAGRPPVGYAAVTDLDGHAHLAELAVHPAHGRQGIGGALLAAACELAVAEHRPAITLATFADVPFNAPWYAARGFAQLPAADWGEQLRDQVRAERAAGIAVAPRVVMIRHLVG
jgi:GNAT superfamily N-acetyltransferase